MNIKCESCGQILNVPESAIGKTGKCNKCFNPVKITREKILSHSPSDTQSSAQRQSKRAKRADEKYCGECGEIIRAKAEICPMCGVRQYRKSQVNLGHVTPSGRNRVAAALFGILLGGFGIHKFYLGEVGLGILYLLFFWTGIPFLIGFVEGIIYLTMTDSAFEKKYG